MLKYLFIANLAAVRDHQLTGHYSMLHNSSNKPVLHLLKQVSWLPEFRPF